ncbi:MAG: transcription termination/antitermination NusG family protein [Tepidisphaeraceae bacterium]|jgi:transcription antitermination factor NusG
MTLIVPSRLAPAKPPLDPFAGTGQWHVLHTKSRQEKILADDLSAMGIRFFLPLNREVRFHGKRKTTVELPIFSGYVFLRGSLDEAYTADRTKRVVNIIRVADQEQLGWELTNLRLALSKNSNVQPYPFLQSGVRVEVRSGPMRGVQGIVENRIGVNRLVLQVKMLGRAVSVEIDPGLLEIVN